jgi:hypothetical protein
MDSAEMLSWLMVRGGAMAFARLSRGCLVVLVVSLSAPSVRAQVLDQNLPPAPQPVQPTLEPAPAPVEPAPPPAPPQDPGKSASETFSSLGGFGVGPGGGLGALLSPTVGNMPVRASLGFSWLPAEDVHNQATNFTEYREDFAISAPIWQNYCNEWSLSTNVRSEEFRTGAVLTNTDQSFPDQLVDVRFGTAYRHEFDNDWIAGVGGSFGSASNEPFHGVNELTVGVNAFLRIPQGEHNAWLFTINYSTTSQINIPIPGIAYLWAPSPNFQAVIGFPFASVNYQPIDDLTLSASYALLTTFHARATYRICKPVRVYAALDFDNESYFLVPREDDQDRFFYYDKRVSTGVQYAFGPNLSLDFSGGYEFQRMYFEGQNQNDRGFDRIDVDAGAYVGLKLLFRY